MPVAIVGAALRFPGATDPASYHELTTAGRQMFRELARTAVDHDRTHSNGTGPPFSLDGVPLRAALLDDWTHDGLAPDGAAVRHVLAAETVAAALADIPEAGRARPGRTGVIIAERREPGTPGVGGWIRDQLDLPAVADSQGAGSDHLSCSLAAVAAACEALNAGELDLVLAGGVSTGIDSAWLSRRARTGGLATAGVRIYDASPTGMLPGEGCGVVALMRAADARASGLPVYADIAGWHAASGSGMDPAALWPAYLRAGIDPADVQLVEGHGAACAADDLAELSALGEVLGRDITSARGRCALGAVPANIGDTRSAAGVAALLKAALAMTADTIPATTACLRPHRLLRAEGAPFRLPLTPEPWPDTLLRVAAVNSLGTAALPGAPGSGPVHIVLRREREPGPAGRRRRTANMAFTATRPGVPAQARREVGAPARSRHRAVLPRPRLPADAAREDASRSQAEARARACAGSQSARNGMPEVPSARSFTPSTWCSCTTLVAKPSCEPAM